VLQLNNYLFKVVYRRYYPLFFHKAGEFLAPDIIEDIIAGRQPADLTADKLIKTNPLSLDWSEQKRKLGFT